MIFAMAGLAEDMGRKPRLEMSRDLEYMSSMAA
jgi:hypothetical protein